MIRLPLKIRKIRQHSNSLKKKVRSFESRFRDPRCDGRRHVGGIRGRLDVTVSFIVLYGLPGTSHHALGGPEPADSRAGETGTGEEGEGKALSSELVAHLLVRDQLRTKQDAMLLDVQDLT
eukprot:superscaffoldBa00004333_g18694